ADLGGGRIGAGGGYRGLAARILGAVGVLAVDGAVPVVVEAVVADLRGLCEAVGAAAVAGVEVAVVALLAGLDDAVAAELNYTGGAAVAGVEVAVVTLLDPGLYDAVAAAGVEAGAEAGVVVVAVAVVALLAGVDHPITAEAVGDQRREEERAAR